jgi:hypothetical protein
MNLGIIMKRIYLCLALSISVAMITGCSTVSYVNTLDTQGYYGKWFKIDSAQTNAPSGAHLYALLFNQYEYVRILRTNFGIPNYVKHDQSEVTQFIYQNTNCLMSIDWLHGNPPEAKSLDSLSDSELPSELLVLRQNKAEEIKRYYGKWFKIDSTQTNVPSGSHLYSVLCKDYEYVRLLQTSLGVPDFVKQKERSVSEFVYQSTNCLVTVDWLHAKPEVKSLDTLSDNELPLELVSLRQKQPEERKLQVQAEAVTHPDKEKDDRESLLNYKIVEAVGIGATQDEAQKNALYSAVEQVVGAIVDAKTQIENDKIVKDQILTLSAGYVEAFKVIGAPVQKDGKYEIKISAKVKRTKLLCDLEDKNVSIKSEVKGEALWAQAVTQGRVKEQADKILEALLSHDPRKICVEQLSQPLLVPPSELTQNEVNIGDTWLRFKLRVYVDKKAFNETFLPKMVSCLDSLVSSENGNEMLEKPRDRVLSLNGSDIDYDLWGRGLHIASGIGRDRLPHLNSATAICRSFMIPCGVERDNEWNMIMESLRIHSIPETASVSSRATVVSYKVPPYYFKIIKAKLSKPVKMKVVTEFIDVNNIVVSSHQISLECLPFCEQSHVEILPAMIYLMHSWERSLFYFDQMDMQVSLPMDANVIKRIKSTRVTILDALPNENSDE